MLRKIRRKRKKGAFELSIGTVVVIVIAMAMLILGLVLVRNIFGGASSSVDLIDKNVKSQINQLFNEDNRKTVVYLPDNAAEVKKGKSYNIVFGIKNIARGESEAGSFTYTVEAGEIGDNCRLTLQQADSYIKLGGGTSRPIKISPGDKPVERTIVFEASDTAPLCLLSYNINIQKDGVDYDTNFFIINIVG